LSDLERILPLWRELEEEQRSYVLATIVAVEGSSYRKPGALMLVAEDGRRAGTVSGGCLEAEVAKRAWWLTRNGPVVESWSTADDEGDRPYGSGCGGRVFLLLERKQSAGPVLAAIAEAFEQRISCAVASIVEGAHLGLHAFASSPAFPDQPFDHQSAPLLCESGKLRDIAMSALRGRSSMERMIAMPEGPSKVWAGFRPERPGLWIFGAGDDAQPLQRMASELGWFVAVADGRPHLATRERFSRANRVTVLPQKDSGSSASNNAGLYADFRPTDAAVLVSHSFEQDAGILGNLLKLEAGPAYIGVLGPQRRTRELLKEVLYGNGPERHSESERNDRIELAFEKLHAPMGIDLGADSPATIALSVVAEIQKHFSNATALPLRELRAEKINANQ